MTAFELDRLKLAAARLHESRRLLEAAERAGALDWDTIQQSRELDSEARSILGALLHNHGVELD